MVSWSSSFSFCFLRQPDLIWKWTCILKNTSLMKCWDTHLDSWYMDRPSSLICTHLTSYFTAVLIHCNIYIKIFILFSPLAPSWIHHVLTWKPIWYEKGSMQVIVLLYKLMYCDRYITSHTGYTDLRASIQVICAILFCKVKVNFHYGIQKLGFTSPSPS